jgi:hypothetical protein
MFSHNIAVIQIIQKSYVMETTGNNKINITMLENICYSQYSTRKLLLLFILF